MAKEIRSDEWIKQGIKLFGKNRFAWRFECPKCGGTQSALDFVNVKRFAAGPRLAFLLCKNGALDLKNVPLNQIGCNFNSTTSDLSQVVIVINPKGKKIPVFPFAKK